MVQAKSPQIIPGNRPMARTSRGTLPTARATVPQEITKIPQGGQELPRAVILTAIPEEFKAVRDRLPQQNLRRETVDGTIYFRGQFPASTTVWDVAIAQIGEGNSGAASETTKAINAFKPDVILLVGVAGGIKDVEIGDVVVASRAYQYNFGKETSQGTETRSMTARASHYLVQQAMAEANQRAWLQRLPAKPSKIPKVRVKPIASDNQVITSRNSPSYQRIVENCSDAIAVEMEGFGFLQAAESNHNVHALVVRGISDLIEGKTAADQAGSQVLAAQHASAFAFEVLSRFKEKDGVLDSSPVNQQDITTAKYSPEQAANIPLEKAFPTDTAIIYVDKRDDQLTLKAYHAIQDTLEPTQSSEIPPITLRRLLTEYRDATRIMEAVVSYEPDTCVMGQFIGWLRELRKSLQQQGHGDLSTLIINDQTDIAIPWEMLALPRKETLGVVLKIVRWQKFRNIDWEEETLPSANLKKYYCNGEVFFCKELRKRKQQVSHIQGLIPHPLRPYSDPEEFLDGLKTSQAKVGLLFIDSCRLHQLSHKKIKLYLETAKSLEMSDSLLFMSDSYRADDVTSLKTKEIMRLFFRYGTKGVIKTTGDFNYEVDVTKVFLKECKRASHQPVIETLRQLRQNAKKHFEKSPTDSKICAKYLAVFSHVYYGQPMMFIRSQTGEVKS